MIPNWIKRLRSTKTCGFIVVSRTGRTLTKDLLWGGEFNRNRPELHFLFSKRALAKIRGAKWESEKPEFVYATISDNQTGKVQITGGPFNIYEMATWKLPPGSPIGPAPSKRPSGFFSLDQPVWIWGGLFLKGNVSSINGWNVYVLCGGTVESFLDTSNGLWPRQEQ